MSLVFYRRTLSSVECPRQFPRSAPRYFSLVLISPICSVSSPSVSVSPICLPHRFWCLGKLPRAACSLSSSALLPSLALLSSYPLFAFSLLADFSGPASSSSDLRRVASLQTRFLPALRTCPSLSTPAFPDACLTDGLRLRFRRPSPPDRPLPFSFASRHVVQRLQTPRRTPRNLARHVSRRLSFCHSSSPFHALMHAPPSLALASLYSVSHATPPSTRRETGQRDLAPPALSFAFSRLGSKALLSRHPTSRVEAFFFSFFTFSSPSFFVPSFYTQCASFIFTAHAASSPLRGVLTPVFMRPLLPACPAPLAFSSPPASTLVPTSSPLPFSRFFPSCFSSHLVVSKLTCRLGPSACTHRASSNVPRLCASAPSRDRSHARPSSASTLCRLAVHRAHTSAPSQSARRDRPDSSPDACDPQAASRPQLARFPRLVHTLRSPSLF